MTHGEPVHEIKPGETYQIDSSEYDSEEERDNLQDDEYDMLVEEAENGYTEEEIQKMTDDLKQKGIVNFLRTYLLSEDYGREPSLRKLLLGFGVVPPAALRHPSTTNTSLLPFTRIALSRIIRRRDKIPQYNTVEDAINLLRTSKKIIVLSGAGISTSCGIPDFRSANGLYAQLQAEGKWDLDDPQQMFDIHFFKEHPEVFYSFAKSIYPSNFVPSPCHRWIKLLEDKGVLLRNYTQNIDTLESLAGVTKVLQCHGSFATASCLRCKTRVPGQTIEPYIMTSSIPYCGTCREKRNAELEAIKAQNASKRKDKGKGKEKGWGTGSDESEVDEWGGGLPGIIKPDITFFGQALESSFDECLYRDREEVDLLVVIGTSLKVAPVSEVLTHIPHSIPQIYINLTSISHVKPDICLLGDAGTIVSYLSRELGWQIPPPAAVPVSSKAEDTQVDTSAKPVQRPDNVKLDGLSWVSLDGLSHVHCLQRESATSAVEDATKEGDLDASPSNNLPTATELMGAEDGDPPAQDGYMSDDEAENRPSKKSRRES